MPLGVVLGTVGDFWGPSSYHPTPSPTPAGSWKAGHLPFLAILGEHGIRGAGEWALGWRLALVNKGTRAQRPQHTHARTQAVTRAHRHVRSHTGMHACRYACSDCAGAGLVAAPARCTSAGAAPRGQCLSSPVPGASRVGSLREPSGAFGAGTYAWVRLPLGRTCGVTRASLAGTGLNYWLASWFASVKPHVRTAAVSAASLAARRPAWGPSREAAGAALVVVWAAGRVASGRRDHGPSRPQLSCGVTFRGVGSGRARGKESL